MALAAAGFDPPKKQKPDNQELKKKAFEHLKKEIEENKKIVIPPKIYNHIFIWGDGHDPYGHPDKNKFWIAIKKHYASIGKPFDLTIDIGDGEDFHGMNFHDHDPDLFSAGHELREVIKSKEEIYDEFKEVMVCESNHGSMVYRKQLHHGLPRSVFKSYREIIEAPAGWTWHPEIVVTMSNGKKCLFHHSYSSNVLLASQKRAMNLVQGHSHSKFSIQYWSNANDVYFAAQTGCLVDDKSMALAYNKLQIERPIMGSMRIENGIPHLLPMLLDKDGRWSGYVP